MSRTLTAPKSKSRKNLVGTTVFDLRVICLFIFSIRCFVSQTLKIYWTAGKGREAPLFLTTTSSWSLAFKDLFQLYMCDHHIFLIASRVITRLPLDETFGLWELPFD